RYGSSGSVPSMLDEPARGAATVVVVATDWPADVDRAVAGILADAPEGTSVVVVANDSADGYDPPADTEVVWTSARLGHATAINAGIRRATAPVVVLLDASVEPTGDFVTPLVAALAAEGVAVAGAFGVTSGDLRTFAEAPAGDVDAIEGYCLAFRRGDFVTRGPLDEHFRFYRNLDLWWSLVLRDEGEGGPPRRAVAIDLPLVRHEHREWTQTPEEERSRLSKRNFYRIIDRFGRRYDLLLAPRAKGR
ncbi:MAG: glycosyltransferase, partial [Candidatus Limnocylindrales bacterium]